MATAAYSQSITTEVKIFDSATDGGPCTEFMIGCNPDSASNVLVRIDGIHKVGEYFIIYTGGSVIFKLSCNAIKSVYAKSLSGTSVIDYGVISKFGL